MRNVQFQSVSQPSGNLYNRHTGSLIFREAKRLRKILDTERENLSSYSRNSCLSRIRSLGNLAREEARVKSDLINRFENRTEVSNREGGETRFPACSKH